MTLYILNLIDLFFTIHALRHGASELNPIMQNIPFMVAYKTIIIGMLCFWLAKVDSRLARIGLKMITAVFAAVDLWHIFNIFWR